MRRQVEKNLLNGVQSDQLVLLTFTKAECREKLRWEHSGEFEFNGQMFDIVKTEVQGDTLRYWCWWDRKETALNRQLRAAGLHPDEPVRQATAPLERLFSFLQTLFCSGNSGRTAHDFDLSPAQEFAFEDCHSALTPVPPKPPPNKYS